MAVEPFLPPPEPLDNPPVKKAKSSTKTLVVWVILIVLFMAIYNVVSTGDSHEVEVTSSGPSTLLVVLGYGIPVALIVAFVVFLVFQLKGGERFDRDQEPGLVALHEGRLVDAATAFEETARRYRGKVLFVSVAKFNVASVLIRQGDFDGALNALRNVERTPGLAYIANVRLLTAASLSLVYALRGELDLARRWIDDGRRRLRKASHRTAAAAELRFSEAVLLTREGRRDEALELLERDWLNLEGTTTASGMRRIWLLKAFLLAQVAPARDQGAVEEQLARLRPYREGELGYLSQEWPELQAFAGSVGIS